MSGSPEYERLLAQFESTIRSLRKLKLLVTPPPVERHPRYWYEHHTYSKTMCDGQFMEMVGKVCDQKLKEKGNFVKFNSKYQKGDTKAHRKKFIKLGQIIKMEHEFCGEEDW